MIQCKCGCGNTLTPFDSKGRPRQYLRGHYNKGRPKTLEHRRKLSESKIGEKNPMWVGDKVSYGALHDWVRSHLEEPEYCEICDSAPPFDLANVTGIYNRDFKNWAYLCRLCHMDSDGRLDKIGRYDRSKRRLVQIA